MEQQITSKKTPKKEVQVLTSEVKEKIINKLQAGKFHIYKNYPFLGHILQRLGTVVTYDIPTMAVDDKGNIYLNPDFVLKLKWEEFHGVLCHETMHISTLTIPRQRGRHPEMWNVATDFIMNRDIIKAGIQLPAGGCIPEKRNDKWYVTMEGKKGKFEVDITNCSAEYLFSQMNKNAIKIQVYPDQDQIIKSGKDGSGKDENGNDMPQPIEGGGNPVNKTPQQLQNDIISAAEAARQEQDEIEKTRGTDAGGIRSHIMSHHTPQVNWRQLLKTIVAKTIVEYNWKRPHKRAMASGYYAPRIQIYDNLAPICVAIDTSGSITNKELSVFVSELQAIFRIYRKAQITVVLWHCETYYHVEINSSNNNNLLNLINTHLISGGTTMSSVANYLQHHNLNRKVAAVIYLTDGYVESNPKILDLPIKNYALITDNYGIKGLSTNSRLQCHKININ